MATHWMVVTETWKSRPSVARATATIVVSRIDMIDPRTTTVDVRRSSGRQGEGGWPGWMPWGLLHNTQRYGVVKEFPRWDNRCMGVAEDAFERLRRVAFEGEHVERMAALGVRLKLSPGVIKTLVRLAKHDGVSMGEMARGIGCDPSYITALVDDLDEQGSGPPGARARRPAGQDHRAHGRRAGRSPPRSTGCSRCRRRRSRPCRSRSCASCATSSTRCWRQRTRYRGRDRAPRVREAAAAS